MTTFLLLPPSGYSIWGTEKFSACYVQQVNTLCLLHSIKRQCQCYNHNNKYSKYTYSNLKFSWILSTSNRIPNRGSSKIGSHVYFLLQVFCVLLLFCRKCCSDATMVTLCQNSTIWHYNSSTMATITGSKHDYLFCDCPLVGILFEVLWIII